LRQQRAVARVARLALKVADIFRAHGPARRRADAGHVRQECSLI
jgi:hypothetical protein